MVLLFVHVLKEIRIIHALFYISHLIFHISLHFSFQNGSSNNFVEFKFPSFPWHFLDYQYIQRTVDVMQSRSKDYDSCFTKFKHFKDKLSYKSNLSEHL